MWHREMDWSIIYFKTFRQNIASPTTLFCSNHVTSNLFVHNVTVSASQVFYYDYTNNYESIAKQRRSTWSWTKFHYGRRKGILGLFACFPLQFIQLPILLIPNYKLSLLMSQIHCMFKAVIYQIKVAHKLTACRLNKKALLKSWIKRPYLHINSLLVRLIIH